MDFAIAFWVAALAVALPIALGICLVMVRDNAAEIEEWTDEAHEPPAPAFMPNYEAPRARTRITKDDIEWEIT